MIRRSSKSCPDGAGAKTSWIVVVTALFCIGAIAAVYLARARTRVPSTETPVRRRARPEDPGYRVDARLERRSPTHIVASGRAACLGRDASPARWRAVSVLLDTGLSLPVTEPSGERLFGLMPGIGANLPSSDFSGARGALMPISEVCPLVLSVAPGGDPRGVAAPVEYLGTDSVAGADLIAPPELLGPEGGAVTIDLANLRFSTCETLQACERGPGWTTISVAGCAKFPELLVIDATLFDARARLLLDTGGSTWLRRGFFDSHSLARGGAIVGNGALVGARGNTTDGARLRGKWPVTFGVGVERSLDHLWVLDPSGGAAVDCGLDGSVGLDSFNGCAIAISDRTPRSVALHCEEPPKP